MIYLYGWAENQILLKILFFSDTNIHRFLWLYSSIECLQVKRMYVTSFWFYRNLGPEKVKKPASYELAIHTFLKIFYIIFFQKRVLDIFKLTFWQTALHQVLYSSKRFCFMSRKTFLLTSILENVCPRLWLYFYFWFRFQPQKCFSRSLLFAVKKRLLDILASLF